jgi:hypothetical protein
MEFLVQRRATFWWTSVYLPLLAMELIVPMAFAMPVQVGGVAGVQACLEWVTRLWRLFMIPAHGGTLQPTPQDLSSRLVLIVTLVLAPAVFKTALTDRLPLVGYLTTMDEQFLFAYIFTLASAVLHTGLRSLLDLGASMHVVKGLNVLGAVASMAVLIRCG